MGKDVEVVWPGFRYYLSMYLHRPRETREKLTKNDRSPGLYLNPEPAEHRSANYSALNSMYFLRSVNFTSNTLLLC